KNIQQQHNFLEAHVQKLISEVKGLGSGDLRSRAEVTSDTLGFLAHSFNYIIDELSNLVIPVKTASGEVETLVKTAQKQMTRLIQINTRQTEDMSEAIEAMEQMAYSTQTVSDHYQFLEETTREIRQMAQHCRDELEYVPHETVEEATQKQYCV